MHHDANRSQAFTRRALVLAGAQLGLFGALGGRLYYLQVQGAEQYAVLADENRISHRLLIPPRGRVLDRGGLPLAQNTQTYRVHVIRERARDLGATLEALGRLVPLTPAQIENVEREARLRRAFVPITVREDLSWEEVSRVAVHAPDLPGVVLDSGLLRSYPFADEVAHLLGYVGPVSEAELTGEPMLELPEFRIGKNGIERAYDEVLRGRAGSSRVEVNALGREIRELVRIEGESGEDIELTIDLRLQRWVYERLHSEVSASAVVMDVDTGEVLALASVPGFDPRPFINGVSHRQWREWNEDVRAPLVNKSISGQYPPGSTFKMVVALAGLEAGVIGPGHEAFCPGHMDLGNHRFHCWRRGGHGRIGLIQGIAQSCDVFFYDVARRVGVDGIAEMSRRFGLGERLGIDLPGERPGLVPTREWKQARFGVPWQRGETLVIGIGQGYMLTTPLQLAVMSARIANGGRAVRPWLVRGAHGRARPEEPAPSMGIADRHMRLMQQGMLEVVHGSRGTARASQLQAGVQMAGKTGTSQVRRITRAERASGAHRRMEDRPWNERHHALYVCYAPYDDPRYAVAVIVEHGGGGASVAAPIARDIMDRTLELDPGRPRGLAPIAERRAGEEGGA
jgi:penicillin-binding protein 2